MTVVIDTSVLIDVLRGLPAAAELLRRERQAGPLWASEMTRLELLAGMRPNEEARTRQLMTSLRWVPVDEDVAELAGKLGRKWLPSHRAIDGADLVIAATALQRNARLETKNVKHFPMFPGLTAPY
ncbi:type II toxin-antitoxin system VapC family toxin [uncultured Jatrophihabitans sp.]|uniref:type II toxin-antitoxin system VapC family toxin n=1 Tax=uncultured Jatrophihabitans sp. TaxID=1610747 RepID=UPI0035CACE0E